VADLIRGRADWARALPDTLARALARVVRREVDRMASQSRFPAERLERLAWVKAARRAAASAEGRPAARAFRAGANGDDPVLIADGTRRVRNFSSPE
jgi:hypothetical protein